jgi:hypothetical protein
MLDTGLGEFGTGASAVIASPDYNIDIGYISEL